MPKQSSSLLSDQFAEIDVGTHVLTVDCPPPARAAPGMPGNHIPAAQRRHAQRRGSAGVHWKTIQKNQDAESKSESTQGRAIGSAV